MKKVTINDIELNVNVIVEFVDNEELLLIHKVYDKNNNFVCDLYQELDASYNEINISNEIDFMVNEMLDLYPQYESETSSIYFIDNNEKYLINGLVYDNEESYYVIEKLIQNEIDVHGKEDVMNKVHENVKEFYSDEFVNEWA